MALHLPQMLKQYLKNLVIKLQSIGFCTLVVIGGIIASVILHVGCIIDNIEFSIVKILVIGYSIRISIDVSV
jgi:hypothetical protein